MPNQNPLAGVVPQVTHPVNDGETYIAEHIEKIEGEVAMDAEAVPPNSITACSFSVSTDCAKLFAAQSSKPMKTNLVQDI